MYINFCLGSKRNALILIGALVAACSPGEPPAASHDGMPGAASTDAGYNTDFTVAEIMDAIVMREADVIWNAVSYSSTADGFVAVGPESEEDWTNLRAAALSLGEATNSLLIPGRHANRPDAEVGEGELTPAEMDALISSEHGTWTAFAQALRSTADEAIAAIDARDVDRILDVGGSIDEACEGCHLVFWYPNQ